jgi:hypothetical protein
MEGEPMGVLSDLVVADADDAEKIVNTGVPSQAFRGADIKGIDTVKFTTLHSILTGRPLEELRPAYHPVATASHEGAWVFVIPTELTALLAHLTEAQRQSAAERWSQTDEFRVDRWDISTIVRMMDEICREAGKATASGKTLFLWMSL